MTRTGKKRQRRMIPRLRLAALLLAAILGVLLFSQTAFARTYVITDGDRVVTYTTFATDPAQVLGQAGMELGAYDTYTTEAVEGGSAITIRRAQEITIKYHGEVMQTTSSGETVGELLSRLNLSKQLKLVPLCPRQLPRHHRKKDHAAAPHVRLPPVVRNPLDALRRRVRERPAERRQRLAVLDNR